jgi:hypothetical protein
MFILALLLISRVYGQGCCGCFAADELLVLFLLCVHCYYVYSWFVTSFMGMAKDAVDALQQV